MKILGSRGCLTAPVERDDLFVDVRLRGSLDSAEAALIESECPWNVTLIRLVPEGTWVEKGDVIGQLDDSELREELQERKISLIQAEGNLLEAKQKLKVQELQNDSLITKAKLDLNLARLDVEKYREGDFPKERRALEAEVALAEEEVSRAEKQYEFVKRLAKKGYKNARAVEEERLKVQDARLKYEAAVEKLNVLTRFTHDREMTELLAVAEEAGRHVQRVEGTARSSLLNCQIQVQSYLERVMRYQEYVDRYEKAVAACKLIAPRDGEVVYARDDSGRSRDVIEVGEQIRNRELIAKIPDDSRMKVDLRIHESQIRRVDKGQQVTVRLDAYPDTVLKGHVEHVNSVPSSGQYPNYDLKEYRTTVMLDESPEALKPYKPGLTAQVSIHVAHEEDCLQVPVQSIIRVGQDMLTFVETPQGYEVRLLEVGENDEASVQVLSGLEEGEKVVLSPRLHFSEELIALEEAARMNGDVEAIAFGFESGDEATQADREAETGKDADAAPETEADSELDGDTLAVATIGSDDEAVADVQ